MELYLASLFTHTLALLLLGLYSFLKSAHYSQRLLPLFLLVISRLVILFLFIIFPRFGYRYPVVFTNAFEVLSTFFVVWILIGSISNLLPAWQPLAWLGIIGAAILALIPLFLPNWSTSGRFFSLGVAAFGIPFVMFSTPKIRWTHVTPLLMLALANSLNILVSSTLSGLVELLGYAALIGAIYWDSPEKKTTLITPKLPGPGDVLKGRYKIKKKVGQGGFGTVYQAYDTKLGGDVALKAFTAQFATRFGSHEEMQQRFIQEARITRQLKHPNIIEIYDLFEDQQIHYIVMPYLPNTLARQLEQIGSLNIAQAVQIMKQICRGLAYAHAFRRGKNPADVVVHCDIKPDNILFDNDQVKITDFGIAHVPKNWGATSTLTSSGFEAGTPFYMPPEQLEGQRDNPRIDVYALGTLFYRILVGEYYLNFEMANTTQARAKNVTLVFENNPSVEALRDKNVPEAIIRIIFKALSKRPEDRYADAIEMLEAITECRADKMFFEPTEYLH